MDFRVIRTDSEGNTEKLTVIAGRVTIKKEAKSNTAEVTLPLYKYLYDGEINFSTDDTLSFYANTTTVSTALGDSADNLIGHFKVKNFDLDENSQYLRVTGFDLTYSMLATLYPCDYTQVQADDIIQNVIQTGAMTEANGMKQNAALVDIQSVSSTGAEFPLVDYASVYKTRYEVISELSQQGYTGDNKPYSFFVSPDGMFHWGYPSSTRVGTLNFESPDVITLKSGISESSRVNMIIFDAGVDKNNASIIDMYLRPDAGTIEGAMKYQPMTDISSLVKHSLELRGLYAGISNADFIALCVIEAKGKSQSIIDKTDGGLWTPTLDVKPLHYRINDLYDVVSSGFSKSCRINQMVHKFNKQGWTLSITMAEEVRDA